MRMAVFVMFCEQPPGHSEPCGLRAGRHDVMATLRNVAGKLADSGLFAQLRNSPSRAMLSSFVECKIKVRVMARVKITIPIPVSHQLTECTRKGVRLWSVCVIDNISDPPQWCRGRRDQQYSVYAEPCMKVRWPRKVKQCFRCGITHASRYKCNFCGFGEAAAQNERALIHLADVKWHYWYRLCEILLFCFVGAADSGGFPFNSDGIKQVPHPECTT